MTAEHPSAQGFAHLPTGCALPTGDNLTEALGKLDACIHCGFCLPACPTYRATGSEAESPRGRLYLMRGLLDESLPEDARFSATQVAPHIDQCLGCQACQTVCPSGVDYGALLHTTRETLFPTEKSLRSWLRQMATQRVLPNPRLLAIVRKLLKLYQKTGLQRLVRSTGLLGWAPALAQSESLLPKLGRHRALYPGYSFGNPSGQRVALLTGCVMDVLYNPVHWATIHVLAQNNFHVSIPEQTCCGALAHHAGDVETAKALARQNIRAMLRVNPDWIVVNSAGCGSTLKDYTHLLADDPVFAEKAQVFSHITVDVMELLAQTPLKPMQPVNETVTYHAACHLHHTQGVQQQPLAVLGQIPGLTLVPLSDATTCCGSAGIFNVEHPALANAILSPKTEAIVKTGAAWVATGNPGCMLQIEKGLRESHQTEIAVVHPIQILAKAYGH